MLYFLDRVKVFLCLCRLTSGAFINPVKLYLYELGFVNFHIKGKDLLFTSVLSGVNIKTI